MQLKDLVANLNDFEEDNAVLSILLTITGRGFCDGADLGGGSGRVDVAPVGMKRNAHLGSRVGFTIASGKKPEVAASSGWKG